METFLETTETKQNRKLLNRKLSLETTETKQETFWKQRKQKRDILETFFRNNGNKHLETTKTKQNRKLLSRKLF